MSDMVHDEKLTCEDKPMVMELFSISDKIADKMIQGKSFYNPLNEKIQTKEALLKGNFEGRADKIQKWIDTEEKRIKGFPGFEGTEPYIAFAKDTVKMLKDEIQKNSQDNDRSEKNDSMKAKHSNNIQSQYEQMKSKHPDSILLFRIGDFYESINKDAIKVSEILGTTLSRRKIGDDIANFTGFPHHALDEYLPQLVRAGQRVAICEALEDPKQTVKRSGGVDEIITPNTSKKNKENSLPENKIGEIDANGPQSKVESKNNSETKQQRPPQLVTPNGEKVTHAHAYQGNTNPQNWYFTAKLDGVQLKPQLMSVEDAAKYANKQLTVQELMQKYYPTKLMEKVPEFTFKVPNVIQGPAGILTVEKFNVYKENNPDRDDVGKYKFYAKVDGRQMSTVASKEDLNAYFDRVVTPGSLVEKNFGEKLGLQSAYEKYVLPEAVKTENIKINKLNDKYWGISIDLGEKGKTAPKVLSYDDAHSYFHWHTASREQLAQKYLCNEIEHLLGSKQDINSEKTEQQKSIFSSSKEKSSYLEQVKLTDFLKALGQPEPLRKEEPIHVYNVPYSTTPNHYLHVNTANNSWVEVKGEFAYAAGGVKELAGAITNSREEAGLTMYVKGVMDAYSRSNMKNVALSGGQETENKEKTMKL